MVAQFLDDKSVERKRTLAIVPAFSVMLEPGQQVIPTDKDEEFEVKVGVSSNLSSVKQGTLHLELPVGWKAQPVRMR